MELITVVIILSTTADWKSDKYLQASTKYLEPWVRLKRLVYNSDYDYSVDLGWYFRTYVT
jgi:hypothetical protein